MKLSAWQTFRPIEQLMSDETNPSNPVIITGCLTLARTVSLQWLQSTFLPRMLAHPRFTSILTSNKYDRYFFQPIANFNALSPAITDYHVVIEPTPDKTTSFEEQEKKFSRRLSAILSQRLDMGKPLWKMFFFPDWNIIQGDEDGCMLVVRVHHAISDGIGLVKFLTAKVIDENVESPTKILIAPERQRAHLGRLGVSKSKEVDLRDGSKKKALEVPEPGVLKRIYEAVDDVYISTIGMLKPDPESVFTRSEVQREKVCALLPPSEFTVGMVKDAARVFGVTLNDILYTSLAGACRRYLKEYGEDVGGLGKLRCAIAINRHAFDKFRETDVSNEFALMSMSLHVDVEERVERLRECVATLRRMKRGNQFVLVMGLIEAVARLPRWLRLPLWRHLTRAASILFTNVPGPVEAVEIGGIGVRSMHFFAPSDGHAGVVVGLFSYMGRLSIGIAGDKGRIERPELLVKFLGEEIQALIQLSKNF